MRNNLKFLILFCLLINTRKSVELRMIGETIYTTIEKIMLKKEGSLSVFIGTRIPENKSKDRSGSRSVGTDLCNDCRAGYQSGRWVLGPRNWSGTVRRFS